MSADFWASGSVVTLSPSESRLTAIPSRLTRWQTSSASCTDIPATKRPDIFRPMEERSENARRLLLVESAIKADRSKSCTPGFAVVADGDYCFMREAWWARVQRLDATNQIAGPSTVPLAMRLREAVRLRRSNCGR